MSEVGSEACRIGISLSLSLSLFHTRTHTLPLALCACVSSHVSCAGCAVRPWREAKGPSSKPAATTLRNAEPDTTARQAGRQANRQPEREGPQFASIPIHDVQSGSRTYTPTDLPTWYVRTYGRTSNSAPRRALPCCAVLHIHGQTPWHYCISWPSPCAPARAPLPLPPSVERRATGRRAGLGAASGGPAGGRLSW